MNTNITIRDYQQQIIKHTIKHFKINNKAIINMCCGLVKLSQVC